MGKGRRYSEEKKLNLKKVFAVIIALGAIIVSVIMLKQVLTKAKNTKPLESIEYYALYQDQKWGILQTNGEPIITPMYQEMPIVVDNKKDVFIITYDINEDDNTYKTKVVNKNNEPILTNYDKVEPLENYDDAGNVWYEKNALKVQKDGKWGLINLDGKEISEIVYDDIETLKGLENSVIVKKDQKLGLLNCKGIKILEPLYQDIQKFGNDYVNGYITINEEGKYGIVSASGETIIDNNYQKIKNIYSDKYFVITEDDKEQIINKNTEKVLTDNFDEISQITSSGVVFKLNDKFGVMDFEGNNIIEPNYDTLKEINTDIFLTQKNGKYGLIDKEQNEKIGFNFKNIYYNKNASIYIAENEDLTQTIMNSNFEVKIVGILSELNTEDGYMKIKLSEGYKYYNFKFEEKNVQDIFPDKKIYMNKTNGKYGFVDSKNSQVVDCIYDEATEINKFGYAAVKKDGVWGAINREGKVVIEPKYNLDEYLKIDFIGSWHLGLDLNMNYYCDK